MLERGEELGPEVSVLTRSGPIEVGYRRCHPEEPWHPPPQRSPFLRPQIGEVGKSLGGSRKLVLKHLKKTRSLFGSSVEKTLQFLTDECGIPEERVSLVLRKKGREENRRGRPKL
ncbi:hypothetical protein GW17_00047777 [Ensete ventricosum]|nr:hypothetical protein GW17_00047777 [Ensete ventricosum]